MLRGADLGVPDNINALDEQRDVDDGEGSRDGVDGAIRDMQAGGIRGKVVVHPTR